MFIKLVLHVIIKNSYPVSITCNSGIVVLTAGPANTAVTTTARVMRRLTAMTASGTERRRFIVTIVEINGCSTATVVAAVVGYPSLIVLSVLLLS